ncbi:MAG TPA: amidohydrolase family protein [Puia sp.]|nr:amidohydrolase family protein [Puia sp.]
MSYLKFKADHLFTGQKMLGAESVLVSDPKGTIEDIIPAGEAGEDIEMVNGLICPGFINCHCHTELSHMRGMIPEKTGLVDFAFEVMTKRGVSEEVVAHAIAEAEDEMLAGGIVAVGDICNNTSTIPQKLKNRLAYYNFVELSGWLPAVAENRFAAGKMVYDAFNRLPGNGQRVSMAPHAPYSVSERLWGLIRPYFFGRTTTMHNQETQAETDLFVHGSGDLVRLYSKLNMDNSFFLPREKSSLESCLHLLSVAARTILVHNTFSTSDDIRYVRESWQNDSLPFFCTCINANRYIEGQLPRLDSWFAEGLPVVIGTDSLASNHSLSILDELKTISSHFPGISLMLLLEAATLNGAKALDFDEILGSFDRGKRPGIIQIENLDGETIGPASTCRRLL